MVNKTCTPPDDPDDPDDPTDPDDPDKPEDPTDPMPKTGASEIVISALGLGSTVTAGGYYIASRKKLM
jgi:LPXTG-motif cell wall-anchored protein